jgi:hypothetical protein
MEMAVCPYFVAQTLERGKFIARKHTIAVPLCLRQQRRLFGRDFCLHGRIAVRSYGERKASAYQ